MIDFKKYGLDSKDIEFISQVEELCINGQNEVTLDYNGQSFVLEPSGNSINVYAHDTDLGHYKNFEDLLLNHKINEKPLIRLIKDLDFGE